MLIALFRVARCRPSSARPRREGNTRVRYRFRSAGSIRQVPFQTPVAARPGGGILGSGRAILASENQYDLDLVDSLRAARAETGKSAIAQLVEIALLTLTGARIGALDYYRYRLYDDRHDWASKRRFIGNRRCREINRRVIDRNFWDQVEDKLLAASILAEAGFRVPAVRAVFGDVEPVPGAARPATRCELAAWLRDPEHHPVFAKPLRGRQGRGAARTCRYDAATDRIELYDGDRVSVEGFIDSLLAALHALRLERVGSGTSDGLVFQEVVRQHPAVVERCGDGLGCLRAYVIVDRGKPRILEWAWKIPAPGVAIDTFRRHSNLLAAIDAETGEVVRLIRGLGPAEEELLDNPHTGLRLVGWSLPDFAALRDCVLRGATLFPDVRFQGWDVAIGADGPVVVEVNAGSGFFPAQLATARGFWNAEFRAFVRRAERENPTRPRGLRRLVRAEDALRRVQEFGRLLRALRF